MKRRNLLKEEILGALTQPDLHTIKDLRGQRSRLDLKDCHSLHDLNMDILMLELTYKLADSHSIRKLLFHVL